MTDEELKKAADEYAPELPSYNAGGLYIPPTSNQDLRDAFIAGANWQKEQMEETYCPRSEKWKEVEETARHEYKNGWKDCKEQMMKEAVEGVVTYDNFGNNVVRAGVFNKDFEYGDKMKIIIVKDN